MTIAIKLKNPDKSSMFASNNTLHRGKQFFDSCSDLNERRPRCALFPSPTPTSSLHLDTKFSNLSP
ncbi:hypothetical protein E2C01_024647 [Portunus trituberculatus]|uniref:Uncharacterized protein n=1 Tax=Portunus trituberculatus TaxID=210409 RepID=A0A5B7EAV5_PORTR|nr:hypothetical protein [Portunus trituberculatus]